MFRHQTSSWVLKPSLPPPPPSSLLWHSADFYTLLSTLTPPGPRQDGGFEQNHHSQIDYANTPEVSQTIPSSYSSIQSSQSNSRRKLPPLPPSSPSLLLRDPTISTEYTDRERLGSQSSDVTVSQLSVDQEMNQTPAVMEQDHEMNRTPGVMGQDIELCTSPDVSGNTSMTGGDEDLKSSVGKVQARLETGKDGSLQLSGGCANYKTFEKRVPVTLDGTKKTSSAGIEQSPAWNDIGTMDSVRLAETERLLQTASECAMVLIFTDQSTQLREHKVKTKNGVVKIDGACVAVTGTSDVQRPGLNFFFISLDPKKPSIDEWSRKILLQLLGRARVICYDAQEIVTVIINHFNLQDNPEVWLKWELLDVKVGAWLLSPDDVPGNFHQVLSRFNISATRTTADEVGCGGLTCQDLALLGPLMVTIYHSLVEKDLWQLFTEVETPIVPILGAMEASGIQVDTGKLLHFDHLLKLKISQVEQSAHKAAKRTFSINSTQQLRQVLFDELQLDKQCHRKVSKTTVLKLKSTSESVLLQLQDLHPLPGIVLEYRQLCKAKGTYIAGLLPLLSEGGVLKPCWQQTGAATGRLVSCNPNIQAFPKAPIVLGAVKKQFVVGKAEEQESVRVRETVVSRDGYSFVSTDFRSIELRLLAHLSEDPDLVAMLTNQPRTNSSADVFVLLAAQWLGKRVEEVFGGDREKAKRVVYAIVYGVGREKLAEILGVSPAAARELNTSFLNRFSQIKFYMQRMVTEARRKGFVETICHRKRWFPQIQSSNPHIRSYSERQAINFPIQGSAADVCKCGMIQTVQMLAAESPRTRLLLQIHDELLFEVPNNDVQLVCDRIKDVLESPNLIPSCKLKVPLEVRVTVGQNWADVSSKQMISE